MFKGVRSRNRARYRPKSLVLVKLGYPLGRLWGKSFQKSATEVSSTSQRSIEEDRRAKYEKTNKNEIEDAGLADSFYFPRREI